MPTLLRLPTVLERTTLRRSTLYALIQTGQFPRPIKLSARSNAWASDEIDAWVNARLSNREAA